MEINKNVPEWKSVGAEPPAELKKDGFKAGYKPPAAYFNWFFNRIYESVKELQAGLSNVDNTSDASKPVSTAQQEALEGKASKSHAHGNAEITDVDASKIKYGTIDIERLPKGALERCVVVASNTARFALTTASVQTGDTVKVSDTGLMYFVIDDSKLSTEAGYTIYTAGQASAVPWAGVTGKPTEFPPSDHAHDNKVTAQGGDIADTKVSAFTTSTVSYPVPVPGEAPKVFMGKIKKFFEDIRNTATGACFIGQIVNNCVTNNAKLPLSAAQGKVLMDLCTKLNSEINVTDISASFEFDNSLGLLNAKKCGKIVLCTIGVNGAKLSTAKWNTIATLINDAYKPNSGSSIPGSVSIGGSIDAGKYINCTYSIAKGTIDVHFMQPLEYNIFVQFIWFIK